MPTKAPGNLLSRVLAFSMAFLVGAVAFASTAPATSEAETWPQGSRPTIVLLHGAFADASGWNGVIEELQLEYRAIAPANPLRGLTSDTAYIRSFLASIEGPIVLVGHSYGGAVMTNAAAGNPNVKALVYVAAFALAPGETVFGITGQFPGSGLPNAIHAVPFFGPDGELAGIDAYIEVSKFRDVFAGDVQPQMAAVMAAAQRPASLATGEEPSMEAAWQTIPSWYVVATQDKTIPPDAQRFMAERAGSTTTELESSHVAMVSHPDAVADVIRQAAIASK